MIKHKLQSLKTNQVFLIGLALHFIINLVSAAFIGIHYDEGYYWLYAQHPAWGYFDHPPMVAWLIMAGETLFSGEFGLRLGNVVVSTASVYLLWKMAKSYKPDPYLFWAMVYSVLLIHPYSFVATPDAPLFFGATLFFLLYKRYSENSSLQNAVFMAMAIAIMLYSKYHGVLVVGFTVLSNLKMLGKKSFWLIVLLSLAFLVPHTIWQYENGFPSIKYHLIDSHKTAYNPMETLNYILSELAVTGPFLGWLFLYAMAKTKPENKWESALKLTGLGTFIFFLVSTFGGDFEAHWTLIAFVPLILLSYKFIVENEKWQKWVKLAGLINFSVLLFMRIVLLTPLAEKVKALSLFTGWDKSSIELKQQIGDYPILFQDTWNRAARFAFYTRDAEVTNLNSATYRHNQFDLYDLDEKQAGKTVYLLSRSQNHFENPEIFTTSKSTWYGKKLENFHSYYNLTFEISEKQINGDEVHFQVELNNPYNYDLKLGSSFNQLASFQLRYHNGKQWVIPAKYDLQNLTLEAQSKETVKFELPKSALLQTDRAVYLTFQIGEVSPIPVKVLVHKPSE